MGKTITLFDDVELVGFGRDTNGNSVIKLRRDNKRAISIQINNPDWYTHTYNLRGYKLNELSAEDIKGIAEDVRLHLKKEEAYYILKSAKAAGSFEFTSGLYLLTQEEIIADQKTWSEGDASKRTDFTTADYWLCGSVFDPIPITSKEDLVPYIQ